MKMSKKKIVTVCLVVALLATGLIGGSLAYFTDTDEKENVFTVGNVGIVLTEPKWDNGGAAEAREVYPGEALAKDPTVTNDGANPCFVKVKVEGLDILQPEGMITYRTAYKDGELGANWKLHEDGYFYYEKVLQPGESTTPVFDQIVIPTTVTNGNGVEKSVDVTAYAVQAQGARPSFAAVKEMKAADIAAWFATCGL
jgi:predicted ribosomally synthesized peptide with SipW-like signal peptide